MTERTHISSSQVPGSAACGHWETLLADALDGLLKPEDEAIFTAHMAACPACTALFEEARRGREWLEFLSPEPEVPEGLLERILAQTGPGQIEGFGLNDPNSDVLPVTQGLVPTWQPGFYGQVRRYAQPRLLMTFAMAFFSIALTLHLTDVRLSGLRLSDLRPSAIRSFMERRITMASTPIIRYYDHLRFVYEVESRMRELRRDAQTVQPDRNRPKNATPGESQQVPPHKDGGSRMDPPQQSVNPSNDDPTDVLETSLTDHTEPSPANPARQLLSGGSARARRERSTTWTA
jgi:hypothetical protein